MNDVLHQSLWVDDFYLLTRLRQWQYYLRVYRYTTADGQELEIDYRSDSLTPRKVEVDNRD